jgi:hypothetical protein
MAEGEELPRMLKPQQLRSLPQTADDSAKAYAPPSTRQMLTAIEAELSRKPLDEIAARLAKLTYGEMIELTNGLKAEANVVWEWAVNRCASEKL